MSVFINTDMSSSLSSLASSVSTGVSSIANGISSITSDIAEISSLLSTSSPFQAGIAGTYSPLNPTDWQLELLPASFNGVPFWYKSCRFSTSRKQAIHNFAFSDAVYAEDLGRGEQIVEFDGFILGTTLYIIRNLLDAAANQAGVGTLIHPSRGTLQASLLDLTYVESTGNYIDITLKFVLTKNFTFTQLNQITKTNTQSSVLTNALDLQGTMVGNFFNTIGSDISSVEGAVTTAISTIAPVALSLVSLAGSAVRAIQAVSGIESAFSSNVSFGRYLGANTVSQPVLTGLTGLTSTSAILSSATSQLQDNAAQLQATALASISNLQTQTSALSTGTSATFVTSVISAVQNTASTILDPVSQINALIQIANTTTPVLMNTALNNVSQTIASNVRRAALVGLANACANYQPTSTNQATTIISLVRQVFQNEINFTADGDSNQDDAYTSLQNLFFSTIADLKARSTNLPNLVEFDFNTSAPVVAYAFKIYGDSTRQDQVLSFNSQTPHPWFFPANFLALSM
jgi:prophage DNA circulation protein